MAENKGKKPTSPENDDETPSEQTAQAEPAGAESRKTVDKRPPGKAAKGRPASARHDDEDEDEDEDDEDDDEDEDDEDDDEEEEEEEEVKAPPPKRPATSKSKPVRAKAAPVAQKKAQGSVYRKPAPAPRAPAVPRKPARHFVPHVGLGLLVVAGSVWVDVAYRPVACLGIAIIIWAYLQIGSANEIIPGQR